MKYIGAVTIDKFRAHINSHYQHSPQLNKQEKLLDSLYNSGPIWSGNISSRFAGRLTKGTFYILRLQLIETITATLLMLQDTKPR